jgi:hypothetical protein
MGADDCWCGYCVENEEIMIQRSSAFPGTVFNPKLERPTAVQPTGLRTLKGMRGMRGIIQTPQLTQFPNQEPLGRPRGMGNFVAAPGLEKFPNGQRLRRNPALGLVDKKSLVRATLRGRRCSGMGDDGTGDIVDPSSGSVGFDVYPDPMATASGANISQSVSQADNAASTGAESAGIWGSPGPMSSVAGGFATPTASSAGNAVSTLLNSIFGGSPVARQPYYGASGLAYGLTSGLQTPITPGSSVTTGGVLLAAGLALTLVLMVKKR